MSKRLNSDIKLFLFVGHDHNLESRYPDATHPLSTHKVSGIDILLSCKWVELSYNLQA